MKSLELSLNRALANPTEGIEELDRIDARENLGAFAKRMLRLTPARHHEFVNARLVDVEQGKIKRLMLFEPPGHGKALALDTPVPTPTGWCCIGDLRPGDRVFDENGLPCNVIWKSPEIGRASCRERV